MSTVGNAASLVRNPRAGTPTGCAPRRRGSPPPRGPDGARLVGGRAGPVAGDAVRSHPRGAEERQALIPRRFDRSRQPGLDHVEARLGFLGRGFWALAAWRSARRLTRAAPGGGHRPGARSP